MSSHVYRYCTEILTHLANSGYVYQVDYEALCEAITLIRGGDPRTLANWIRTLKRLGFIEEVKPRLFKLNLEKCPEALTRVVKNVGQKKLMRVCVHAES